MQTESDVDRIVRSWLHADAGSADRLVADVMARLDAAPQRFTVAPSRRVIDLRPAALFAIAVAAVVVIAVVGVNWSPSTHVIGGPSASASLLPQPTIAPTPGITAVVEPLPASGAIEPGTYRVTRPEAVIRFTLPDGWTRAAGTVHKVSATGGGGLTLTLGEDVMSVATNVCVGQGAEQYVTVGPSAEDLTTALMAQIAHEPSEALREPTRVKVDGYPATHFELTYPIPCPGPEGRWLWDDGTGDGAGILKGGITTIDVVDVDGARLVVTSGRRGTTAGEDEELDAIMASIRIERPTVGSPAAAIRPDPDIGVLPIGRSSQIVGGVRFSFSLSKPFAWSLFDQISINRSIAGPQGAEAMVYWAGYPHDPTADPCGPLTGLPAGATTKDLAAAISSAPGTEPLVGPSMVTVDGRPATHLVFSVRDGHHECDPGYLYRWSASRGGPLWTSTDLGDTIRVWIVDVDGATLLIVGETHRDLGPGVPMTDAQRAGLDADIQELVDSIKFE